ncbi:hypothetical protein HDU92_008822 [Lobulomyces angularis]|nr:hypothetical protein HDU92_008822 [Lobulomyces angularis]
MNSELKISLLNEDLKLSFNSIRVENDESDELNVDNMKKKLLSVLKQADLLTDLSQSKLSKKVLLSTYLSELSGMIESSTLVDKKKAVHFKIELESKVNSFLKSYFGLPDCSRINFQSSNSKNFESEKLIKVCRAAFFKLLNAFLHHPTMLVPTFYIPDDENCYRICSTILKEWDNITYGVEIAGEPVLRIVPTLRNSEKLNCEKLEEFITADVKLDRKPCLVIGRAGTPITGELDDIQVLLELKKKYVFWLHEEGELLSLLINNQSSEIVSEKIELIRNFDSLSADFGKWFDFGNDLPIVTFFNSIDWSCHQNLIEEEDQFENRLLSSIKPFITNKTAVLKFKVFENGFVKEYKKLPKSEYVPYQFHEEDDFIDVSQNLHLTLPLWTFCEHSGLEMLIDRVSNARKLVKTSTNIISLSENFSLLEEDDANCLKLLFRFKTKNFPINHFPEEKVVVKDLNSLVDSIGQNQKNLLFEEELEISNDGTKAVFANLPEKFRKKLRLDLIEIEGVQFLRYSPLKLEIVYEEHEKYLCKALEILIKEGKKIQSSLNLKKKFKNLIETKFKQLKFIEKLKIKPILNFPTEKNQDARGCSNDGEEKIKIKKISGHEIFFGLGGVRYFPSFLGSVGSDFNEESLNVGILKEIQDLNIKISKSLIERGKTIGWEKLFALGKFVDSDIDDDLNWGDNNSSIFKMNENEVDELKYCIRIGIDKEPFDENRLIDILNLINETGLNLEKENRVVDHVSEMIKRGIKLAEQELRNENETQSIRNANFSSDSLNGKTFSIAQGFKLSRISLDFEKREKFSKFNPNSVVEEKILSFKDNRVDSGGDVGEVL